uniref:Putative secreted protein n=1 Tax=Anopheles darlingi TaxID=43151 RepID=A0A2M4DAD2_ANODA
MCACSVLILSSIFLATLFIARSGVALFLPFFRSSLSLYLYFYFFRSFYKPRGLWRTFLYYCSFTHLLYQLSTNVKPIRNNSFNTTSSCISVLEWCVIATPTPPVPRTGDNTWRLMGKTA